MPDGAGAGEPLVSSSVGPVDDAAALLGVVCWIATVNPPKEPRAAPAAA